MAVFAEHIIDTQISVDMLATTLKKEQYNFKVPGTFQVANDGYNGCLAGGKNTGDITLTEAAAAYCKAVDGGVYANLAVTAAEAGYTANYQLFPDTPADNDAVMFGAAIPFCEIYMDMSATVQTFSGDAFVWEYSTGTDSWSTLTLVYDHTDAVAQDGKRSFGRDGAIAFVPPADWVAATYDSQAAYWIRCRAATAANMGTIGITNSKEHQIASLTDGFTVPKDCNITTVRLVNANTTVQTNAVKLVLMNFTKGTYSKELTLAASKYQDSWTGTDLKAASAGVDCDADDVIGFLCTQEDGTNEVTNASIELDVTLT